MRKAQSRLPQRPSSSISGLLMPALEAHTGESHATARISTSTAGTQSGLLRTVSGPAGTLAVNSPTDSTAFSLSILVSTGSSSLNTTKDLIEVSFTRSPAI